MKRVLLSIGGLFSINSYGVMIAIGVYFFMWLVRKDFYAIALGLHTLIAEVVIVAVSAGIVGGRLLYIITEPGSLLFLSDIISWGNGGFSLLGAIIGIVIALVFFLKKIQIPVLPAFDIIALYAPVVQSISRIGCFFAGCCYGIPTDYPWGFVYTDAESMAPLYIALHPTQLYSAVSLGVIFLLLYFVVRKICSKNGQLFAIYLILVGMERFFVDFWRDDRVFHETSMSMLINGDLAINQLLALLIVMGSFLFFMYVSMIKNNVSTEK